MSNISHSAKYPVQSLGKALGILNYLAEIQNPQGKATLAEISAALDLGKSNAHRLIDTLTEFNYIERCDNPVSYRLGWAAYRLGNSVSKSHTITSADFSILDSLCHEISETLTVGVRSGNHVLIIYRALPASSLRVQVETGNLEPLHATSMGKMLLSELQETEIIELLSKSSMPSFTENTITDTGDYINVLRHVQKCGYAYEHEEYEMGLNCIAYPIRDYESKIIASVSVTIPTSRFTLEYIEEIAPKLASAARSLSKAMGYR